MVKSDLNDKTMNDNTTLSYFLVNSGTEARLLMHHDPWRQC